MADFDDHLPAKPNGGCGQAYALSLPSLRSIAREFAPLIGMMIDAPPTDDHSSSGLAVVGARTILADLSFFDAIIEEGCRCHRSLAEKLPLLTKMFLGYKIIKLTEQAYGGQPIWPLIRQEIEPDSERLSGGRR